MLVLGAVVVALNWGQTTPINPLREEPTLTQTPDRSETAHLFSTFRPEATTTSTLPGPDLWPDVKLPVKQSVKAQGTLPKVAAPPKARNVKAPIKPNVVHLSGHIL
jgi:hypothetical protein